MNLPASAPSRPVRLFPGLVLLGGCLLLWACATKPANTVTRLAPYPVTRLNAQGYHDAGIQAQKLGDLTYALDCFTHAIDLDPNNPDTRFRRGGIYTVRGNFTEAITDFTRAITIDPTYAPAYAARGKALFGTRDYAAALVDYDFALQLDPKYVNALIDRGLTYRRLKRVPEAIADFDRAIALDPANAIAYYDRGLARSVQHDYPAALADFDRAIADSPKKFISAYDERAHVRMMVKDHAGALADINEVIAAEPNNADHYGNRGQIRNLLKDWPGALADFNRALELDPRGDRLFSGRAYTQMRLKNYPAAIADCDRHLAIAPDDARILAIRGDAQRHVHNYPAALTDYGKALKINPKLNYIYLNCACVCWIQGENAAALSYCKQAIAHGHTNDNYAYLFRHLLLRRLHRDGESNLATLVPAWAPGWPKTIGLYLTGGLTDEELFAAIKTAPDEKTPNGHLCEAYFYSGMNALLDHRPDAAAEKFTACLATGVTDFTEYDLARAELSSLPAPAAK